MFCESKGITLTELAKRSGISESYLSRIANAKRINIRQDILTKLAQELDISTEQLEMLLVAQEPLCKNSPEECVSGGEMVEFQKCIIESLDALNSNNLVAFENIMKKVAQMDEQKVPFKHNYLELYEAIRLGRANRYDEALERLKSAMQFIPKSVPETRLLAKIIGGLGSVYVAKGNYKSAMQMFRKSLMIWGRGGQAGLVYLNMGTLYRRRHQYSMATQYYKKAIVLGVPSVKLLAYTGLGQLSLDMEDYEQAKKHLLRGYWLAKLQKHNEGKDNLYCNLGKYYKAIGKLERAINVLKLGKSYAEHSGDVRTQIYIMVELADAYLQIDDIRALEQTLECLETEIIESGDVLLVGNCLNVISKKYTGNGEKIKALRLLNQSYKVLRTVSPSRELWECCRLLYRYHLENKEPCQADFYLSESRKTKKGLNSK